MGSSRSTNALERYRAGSVAAVGGWIGGADWFAGGFSLLESDADALDFAPSGPDSSAGEFDGDLGRAPLASFAVSECPAAEGGSFPC
jgi:hypothetical protein